MTVWNVETIRDLILEAGRIALHYYDAPQTERKRDSSLVTVADRAVEDFLRQELAPGDDGASLIGEESVDGTEQRAVDKALLGTTWVVDPIDGTAPYANRLPTWGISIGMLHDGRFAEGALFMPRTGELFITSGTDVLYQESTRDPASWSFDDLAALPPATFPYVGTAMISLPHNIARGARFTGRNPVQSNGSAVYSIANVVLGSYLAYITQLKLWDLAGSVPILRRRGFHILFPDGRELAEHVLPTDWITDAGGDKLWKCTGTLYIAHDLETLDYLREHYLPG